MSSVRIASGNLRKDVKLLKEEVQNVQRIHEETRKELKELKEIVYKIQTATGDEERQHMETRVQRRETTIELLDEQDPMQRSIRLEEICGRIDQDLRVVQDSIKIVSENQNAVVRMSFEADRNASDEPNESQQGETTLADSIQRDTIRRDWQNQRYNEPIIRPLLDGRLILHKLLSTKFVMFCPRDVDGVR